MIENKNNLMNKKGQVAIFVIVAIVIVIGVTVYLVSFKGIRSGNISSNLSPVYDYYESCISSATEQAIEIAETQGGRIVKEDYTPGSEYAPFANQLNFLGIGVPYWFYISGNGLIKENVPKKAEVKTEIEEFLINRLRDCDFSVFDSQGFTITNEIQDVKVEILDENVNVVVSGDLAVVKEDESALKSSHEVQVDTKFGKFFDLALSLYTDQKNEALIEQYAVDVLRLYAPVDGFEISCSPKTWKTNEVVNELKQGLEANIQTLRFEGNYYQLKTKGRQYFVIDREVDEAVNLMYSQNWPTKVEIFSDDVNDDLMIANPVGNQPGLDAMGFCYIPYHFVYDVSFPVMIQIYNAEEIFQFPVVVIIDNNMPREAEFYEIQTGSENFDLCEYKTQDIKVNVYDGELEAIDANISYKCFDQLCRLGETENGVYNGKAPSCLNGAIIAKTDGYSEEKKIFSTNSESYVELFLNKEYDVEIEVKTGGQGIGNSEAFVSFVDEKGKSKSLYLPETKSVSLSQGLYNISVYVYGSSSIVIPASTTRQCYETSKGILGIFGIKDEECMEITSPETRIERALIGGGVGQEFLLSSELESGKLVLVAGKLDSPDSIEKLQDNFEIFSTLEVYVDFE